MSTIIKLTKSSTSNSDLDIKFKEFIPIEYTEDDSETLTQEKTNAQTQVQEEHVLYAGSRRRNS